MNENGMARTGTHTYGLLHTDGPRVLAGLAEYSRLEFGDGETAWIIEGEVRGHVPRTRSGLDWRAAVLKVAHRVASLLL